jgi:hypothetical protein
MALTRMAKSKARFAVIFVLGLPIFVAALVFGPAAFDLAFRHRPPERYLIPSGFSGWVRVDYRQTNSPPLPVEDGHRLITLNAQGETQTSSEPLNGHGNDDFFYYSAGGQRTRLSNAGVCKGGLIWEVETMVDERTSTPFTRLFVGTEDRYRQAVDPTGKNLPACE